LTLVDLCDVAYVIHVERLERQVLSDRQAAATFKAAGAEKVEMPTVDERRADFDAALVAEPEPEPANVRLLRAIGVA